jgi:collagenase-like PrtC family protease
MKDLAVKNQDIEFEVFVLNTLCVYIDGFCTFMHAYGDRKEKGIDDGAKETAAQKMELQSTYDFKSCGDACFLKYKVGAYDAETRKPKVADSVKPTFFKQFNDSIECGACAIYDIDRAGVKIIKIVGRQYSSEKRLSDTKFIRSALDILKNNPDIGRRDFIAAAQELYRKNYDYKLSCRGNNCYFPDVLIA